MGSNIRRRPDNRCVRNRSSDRQGYRDRRNTERRSRSNERYGSNRKVDRYKRSRSNNRWQDNKDIELNNLHESIDSRYNRSRSKSLGRKRTPSRDLASDEHKLEHRRKNNYLHSQNSKSKSNEILDLTDDLEEGEITGESDNLVIEEPIQKTRYVTDDKTKSLTIEEYRNRKKTVTNTEAKESNILSQVTVKESIEKLTDTNRIIKKEPSKNSEDCHEHLIPKIETGYESNTHTENIENTEMVFKNVIKSEDALKPSTEDIKPIIEDIPVKNCKEESEKTENTCERNKQLNDSSLNDSTNSTSKLFSGDDSRFSNDSSIAGNNESTSSHNNSINTSIRQRRRRCVVIGLKVKA